MRQAYSYCRVSGVSQLEKSGLKRQRKAIADYAKRHKLKIVRSFEEQASGSTESRKQLIEMLVSFKRTPEVRVLIIESISRLGRDLIISEKLISDLKQLGVHLISVHDGTELTNGHPSRAFARQVLAAAAELEKAMLVEKLRVSRELARKDRGKCEGKKSVEEVRPELLPLIRSLRRKRPNKRPMSYSRIADELNRRGHRSVTGRPFSGKLIQYLVTPGRKKPRKRTTSPE